MRASHFLIRKPYFASWTVILLVTALISGSAADASTSSGNGNTFNGNTFTIPLIVTSTGTGASFGQGALIGIKLALREVNASGGVDGYKLAVHVNNDTGSAVQAVTFMRNLVGKSLVILGPLGTQTTNAAWPFAKAAAVPVVGATQSVDVVAATKPWGFDATVTGPSLSAGGAKKFVAATHVKSVVSVIDEQSLSADVLGLETSGDLAALGVNVKKVIIVDENQPSYQSEAATIASLKPDGVMVSVFDATAGVFMKALRSAGVNQPVLLAGAALSANMLAIAGDAASNSYNYAPFPYNAQNPPPRGAPGAAFFAAYEKVSNGFPFTPNSPFAHDAVLFIANALRASHVLTSNASLKAKRLALAKAMGTVTVKGAIGKWKIGPDNYIVGGGTFVKVGLGGVITIIPFGG